MKVNGTRVEDLAGTGLVTNQRYVMPLWITVPIALTKHGSRAAWWLLVHLVRYWTLTVPAFVLLVVYAHLGGWGVITALMWVMAAGLAWARRWPASFDRYITRPVRGWWRWQTKYRRGWYGAMNGTGITRTTPTGEVYVPRVAAVRSTRIVDTLHVDLLHGHTPVELAEQAEGLRHVYRAHRCTVVEDGPGRVRILFYARDPLTRTITPIDPPPAPALNRLPVGLAEDGTTYALHLLGRHVLIAGASGAGKGSVLWSLIRSLAPAIKTGTVRLRGVDPKGGMELYPGRPLFAEYADEEPADLVALLERAVADMHERKRRLKAAGLRVFVPSATDPLEVIVVDELAFLTAYATKDVKLKVAAALQVLLSQGRAVGISVVAALQDPRKDVLPFRDLFTYRIALRLAEDSHVDMVLDDGALERGAACHLIPASLPGIAFVRVEGANEPVRVRFSYLTDDDITAMADTWPAPENTPDPAPELEGQDEPRVIDLREPLPTRDTNRPSPYAPQDGTQP
jgi:DNA segregation ATPase FtsK/SpoIIIE, S-DNA-T family